MQGLQTLAVFLDDGGPAYHRTFYEAGALEPLIAKFLATEFTIDDLTSCRDRNVAAWMIKVFNALVLPQFVMQEMCSGRPGTSDSITKHQQGKYRLVNKRRQLCITGKSTASLFQLQLCDCCPPGKTNIEGPEAKKLLSFAAYSLDVQWSHFAVGRNVEPVSAEHEAKKSKLDSLMSQMHISLKESYGLFSDEVRSFQVWQSRAIHQK